MNVRNYHCICIDFRRQHFKKFEKKENIQTGPNRLVNSQLVFAKLLFERSHEYIS